MLVGNKSDEESGKREVAEKTGQALQVYIHFVTIFIELKSISYTRHLYHQTIKFSLSANVEMQIHGNICEEWNKCN